ncbi:hypothetical protein [Robertkochia flava]|nr:hypothetical protein [Robertkochia marina]
MDVIISKLLISLTIFGLIFLAHHLGKKTTYSKENLDQNRDAA